MHPDIHPEMHRLLLVYLSAKSVSEDIINSLYPALVSLTQTYPTTSITLLSEVAPVWTAEFSTVEFVTPQTWQIESKSLTQIHPDDAGIQNSKSLDPLRSIQKLQQEGFDAAIAFTAPEESPFAIAYLCYLAGIPIRVGQSQEFGGRVLSTCVKPPLDPVELSEYHLHLLRSAGLIEEEVLLERAIGANPTGIS